MSWLIPTLVYVLAVAALGITSKLALRTLSWPDLILWSGIGYLLVVPVLLIMGQTHLRLTAGSGWAIASAALAIGGLMLFYFSLGLGDAGKVIAVSSAYPAVTLVMAAVFLSEALTVGRVVGAGVIVAGVIIVTLAK